MGESAEIQRKDKACTVVESGNPGLGVRASTILLLLCVAAISILCVLSPSVGFYEREAIMLDWPNAFAFGPNPTFLDLLSALDWQAFDGLERARFVSNLFDVLDAKAAYAAVKIGVPIVAWRPTALLSLLLAVPLMVRTVKGLGAGKAEAFLAASLLLCSEGFLSGVSMSWHAGKPLALLAALALAAALASSKDFPKASSTCAFLATLFGGLCDEGFWFAAAGSWFLCLPVLSSSRSILSKTCAMALGAACAGIFAVWIAPALAVGRGLPAIDVVSGYSSLAASEGGVDAAKLVRNGFLETCVLLWSHSLPFFEVGAWGALSPAAWFDEIDRFRVWGKVLPLDPTSISQPLASAWLALGTLGLLAAAGFGWRSAPPRARRTALLSLAAIASVGYGQALMAKGYYLSAFYYGSASSIFWAIGAASLVASLRPSRDGRTSPGIRAAAILSVVALQQFLVMAALWEAGEFNGLGFGWSNDMKRYVEMDAAMERAGEERLRLVSAGADPFRVRIVFSEAQARVRKDWWSESRRGSHPQVCSACLVVESPDRFSLWTGEAGAVAKTTEWRRGADGLWSPSPSLSLSPPSPP